MKNKGFTLIELLAVIVILAIIALIATPIILNIIDETREESNKRSIELYRHAVDTALVSAQMFHSNATITSVADLKSLGYLGEYDHIECQITIENNKVTEFKEETCVINNDKEDSEEQLPETTRICQVVYDVYNDGIGLGDEVKCAETEYFSVIPNDSGAHPTAIGNNITLLTKNNLDVGNKSFSNDPYWDPEGGFIYNSNSLLYTHVDNYKNKLLNMGIEVKEASLPSYNQINQLFYQSETPPINLTNFWLGDSFGYSSWAYIVTVTPNLEEWPNNAYNHLSPNETSGIRPVIIIDKNNISK